MSKIKKDSHRPPEDAVWYLSLGGAGEIGMNMSLYGTAGKWLMVDCGITFGDETTPGVDIIMPDVAFIADRHEDLIGMVITHGHEDHIGAIAHLWPKLQCPIYATKFTAELIRSKLERANLKNNVHIIEVPLGGNFEIGPYRVEFVQVTHSVPEASMIAITTKHGRVLHTGDWKFDPEPVVGNFTDTNRIKEIGNQGLMAIIGDSTNALVSGRSGSEQSVQDELLKIFSRLRNRIVISCFSSNIARIKSIALAAEKTGRYVTLVGRSLWRNTEIAEYCGYLSEFNNFLSENEAMLSPRDKVVMICTGCQGEPRSALSRIAIDDHPEVDLDPGDTVIFSSRDIPGNEKQISKLQNRLIEKRLNLITFNDGPVHVSGHPAQDELIELYQWTRPNLLLPVHGEPRHQMAHARIARECQVPATLIPTNGQIIRLGPGIHEVVAQVPTGRLGMDGKLLRQINHEAAKDRMKMSFNGAVAVTIVVDQRGDIIQEPQISLMGLVDDNAHEALFDHLIGAVENAIDSMPRTTRTDDNAIRHNVAQSVRRALNEIQGKKPVTEVHLVRV